MNKKSNSFNIYNSNNYLFIYNYVLTKTLPGRAAPTIKLLALPLSLNESIWQAPNNANATNVTNNTLCSILSK